MSSKAYREAYQLMTEKQKDIMHELYMKGVNHDGHSWCTFTDIEDAVAGIIKNGYTQQWIPSECGENIPEFGDAVLVTFKDSDGEADVYIARWGGNFYDCGYFCLSVSEVLAFMPLPQPWEGGQE